MNLKAWIADRKEPLLFAVLSVIFLGPVFNASWLLTLDGPSHWYNAEIIRALWSGNADSALANANSLTPVPVPNWTGHFLLAVFGAVFSASASFKILHTVYLLGFLYGYRKLMTVLYPEKQWPRYFAFAFVYNYFFFLGFYNFLFSVVLMFFIAAHWISTDTRGHWRRDTLVFMCAFILLWFTHLSGFVMTLLLIGIFELSKITANKARREPATGRTIGDVIKVLLVPMIVPVVCTWLYYSYKQSGMVSYLPTGAILHWLWSFELLTPYATDPASFAFVFRVLLLIAPLAMIAVFVRRKNLNTVQLRNFIFCCAITVLVFVLIFIAPDGDGSGGFITHRLICLCCMLVPFVLAGVQLDQRITIGAMAVLVFMGWKLMGEQNAAVGRNNTLVNKVIQAGEHIERGSTFAGYVFRGELANFHVTDLALTGKECVSLDNYETLHDYFPVKFINRRATLDSVAVVKDSCSYVPAQYVMIVGDYTMADDTVCSAGIMNILRERYEQIVADGEVKLYRQR